MYSSSENKNGTYVKNHIQIINSHASTAEISEFTAIAGSAVTTPTIANIKMMTPRNLHFIFLSPMSPEIPAESIKSPTAAEISPGISNAKIACNADIGA